MINTAFWYTTLREAAGKTPSYGLVDFGLAVDAFGRPSVEVANRVGRVGVNAGYVAGVVHGCYKCQMQKTFVLKIWPL